MHAKKLSKDVVAFKQVSKLFQFRKIFISFEK